MEIYWSLSLGNLPNHHFHGCCHAVTSEGGSFIYDQVPPTSVWAWAETGHTRSASAEQNTAEATTSKMSPGPWSRSAEGQGPPVLCPQYVLLFMNLGQTDPAVSQLCHLSLGTVTNREMTMMSRKSWHRISLCGLFIGPCWHFETWNFKTCHVVFEVFFFF